ncbi:MAG TPA: hypothetical protein VKV31_01795 [bacterium]|nr:hypothetical protein [bacterium]
MTLVFFEQQGFRIEEQTCLAFLNTAWLAKQGAHGRRKGFDGC